MYHNQACGIQVSNYFAPTEKAKEEGYNAYLTDKNAERLATALCRMRGAALKLGQMLSIQDEGVLPPQVAFYITSLMRKSTLVKTAIAALMLGSMLSIYAVSHMLSTICCLPYAFYHMLSTICCLFKKEVVCLRWAGLHGLIVLVSDSRTASLALVAYSFIHSFIQCCSLSCSPMSGRQVRTV